MVNARLKDRDLLPKIERKPGLKPPRNDLRKRYKNKDVVKVKDLDREDDVLKDEDLKISTQLLELMEDMQKRFKVGKKRRRSRISETKPVVKPVSKKSDNRTIYEDIIISDEVMDSDEHKIASLDAGVDQIIDIFSENIEPWMSDLAETLPPGKIELLREMRSILDEGVYPYLNQFADLADAVVEEE